MILYRWMKSGKSYKLYLVVSLVLFSLFGLFLYNQLTSKSQQTLKSYAMLQAECLEAGVSEKTNAAYVEEVSQYTQNLSSDQDLILISEHDLVTYAVPDILLDHTVNDLIQRQQIEAVQKEVKATNDAVIIWRQHGVKGVAYKISGLETLWVIETIPDDYFQTEQIIFWRLLAAAVTLFALLYLMTYKVLKQNVKEPVEYINKGLNDIMKADYSFEYAGHYNPMIDSLGETTMQVVNHLSTQRSNLFVSQQQLKLILDHIILGVLVINKAGKVDLFNPATEKILGIDQQAIGRSYQTVIKSFLLANMIKIVSESGQAMSDEIEMFIPASRYIDVNIIPFSQEDANSLGSVIVLLYDVTEIHRLEKVRTEFVSNASHELRTPVTAIKGFAETLQSGALESPELAQKFIGIIANESNRLEVIINDILELTRVEKQTEAPSITLFDVVEVANSMSEFFRKKAAQKEIHITVESDEYVFFTGDQHRVEQIFTNLIDNAINYSDVGGQIKIRVWNKKKSIAFSVSDTGIGIPEEDQERVFERFYRVDKGRSRNSGGTGLGLAIVRNLVKNFNGKIKIESTVGEGTTFQITLPKN